MISEGDQFPEFSLPDQTGQVHTLAELKGQKAVIYFYPKDDTSGCTAEACEFNESLSNISGARLIGVSPDNSKSHQKFAEKYGLKFTLLADTERALAEKLGIWVEKSMYGKKYMGIERTTYLIDENGKIVNVWRKVKPQGHASEVMASLK